MQTRVSYIAIIVLSLTMSACGILPTAKPTAPGVRPSGIAPGIDPSGAWLYQELGQSLVLNLDAKGDGKYQWKDGSFRTESIADHVWTGTWFQTGNDREGGFIIEMNANYTKGKGRWWYTRIGKNKDPERPGGRFSIRRQPAPE